jgi:hypothetical protein
MPRGTRIKMNELTEKIAALDIDEGIRIVHDNDKIFINKNWSGIFVVQFDNSEDFRYFNSANQVTALVKSKFGVESTAWLY